MIEKKGPNGEVLPTAPVVGGRGLGVAGGGEEETEKEEEEGRVAPMGPRIGEGFPDSCHPPRRVHRPLPLKVGPLSGSGTLTPIPGRLGSRLER